MSSTFFKNPIFVQIGYEEKTTFWRDFSIAELYGENGIKDTYERAKQDWQDMSKDFAKEHKNVQLKSFDVPHYIHSYIPDELAKEIRKFLK